MIISSRLSRCLAALFLACCAGPALAAEAPKDLGKSGLWAAYRMPEGGQPVCYMSLTVSPPQAKKQKGRRGDITLMITHRPADNSTDVVSYTAGMKFKPASEAAVTIGSQKFGLFTQGDTAWSRDASTDHALAAAIRNGASMSVTGVSAQDALIAETLSLKGAFAAYVLINKACGLPVPEAPKTPKAAKASKAKPAAKPSVKTRKKKQP
ncbi:MAG: invasion associated locus B family protein [Alphaproteobacteria bacterium]|nr:invasion associated locus B family protein [Alphaproteobacteria bacterium]